MVNYEIVILKLMALTAPILSSWGFPLSNPLVLIYEGGLAQLLPVLRTFEPFVFNSSDKISRISTCLKSEYSEIILFYYDGTPKAKGLLSFINAAVKTGVIEGQRFFALPLIISPEVLPADVISNVFYIEIDNIDYSEDYRIQDFLPKDDEIALVKDIVFDLCKSTEDITEAMKAALCFLYPHFKQADKIKYWERLMNYPKLLALRNSQLIDSTGVQDVFITALGKWIELQAKVLVCELPANPEIIFENKKTAFFYTNDFVYISNSLFADICQSLKTFYGVNTLKRMLAEQDVLISGIGRSYLSKMPTGTTKRLDMLKFNKYALSSLEGLDIISKIKGGNNYVEV